MEDQWRAGVEHSGKVVAIFSECKAKGLVSASMYHRQKSLSERAIMLDNNATLLAAGFYGVGQFASGKVDTYTITSSIAWENQCITNQNENSLDESGASTGNQCQHSFNAR